MLIYRKLRGPAIGTVIEPYYICYYVASTLLVLYYIPHRRTFSPDGGFVGMAKFSGLGHMPATEKDGVFKCSHFLSLAVVEYPPRTRVCTTRVDTKWFLPARHSRLAANIVDETVFSKISMSL